MGRSSLAAALAFFAAFCAAKGARADDVAECVAASEKGQQLRDESHLIEARGLFTSCARDACPTVVRRDCATWLEEVNTALPSIVLSARDARGADLLDVRVIEGDRILATKLDGTSVLVDPGAHTLRFERGAATATVTVIVREGERHRAVAVTLDAPPPVPPVIAEKSAPPAPPDTSKRTAGWIVGAAGLAGIGVGAVFGVEAIAKRSDSDTHCPNGRCTAAGVSLNDDAKADAWISDVGIGLGVVALAVGAYLVVTGAPAPRAAASVRVIPAASPRASGVALQGIF